MRPRRANYENILQSLRFSSDFDIVFPDGSSFSITLNRSGPVVAKALECWATGETGAAGFTPFEDGESRRNPFE